MPFFGRLCLPDEVGLGRQGMPVQCRVVQNKEPPHFYLIFKGRFVVHQGGIGSVSSRSLRLGTLSPAPPGCRSESMECLSRFPSLRLSFAAVWANRPACSLREALTSLPGGNQGFKNSEEADSYDTDGTRLFHIKGTDEYNTRAIQVAEKASVRIS